MEENNPYFALIDGFPETELCRGPEQKTGLTGRFVGFSREMLALSCTSCSEDNTPFKILKANNRQCYLKCFHNEVMQKRATYSSHKCIHI